MNQTDCRLPCAGQPSPGRSPALPRRDFLKLGGCAATALAFARMPVMAGPFTRTDFEKLVPADKKLDPAWVKSLFERGSRTVYRWPESQLVGMPLGGICCGQLYLGGDGKLWHWDIFNKYVGTGDGHYAKPPKPSSPLDQGFALAVSQQGSAGKVRPLDHTGWREISFNGEYPIATVEYRDPDCPVTVSLEAFSPFIPLSTEDSALPATVMRFTVRNAGTAEVEAEVGGWLQNAVCLHTAQAGGGQRRNRIARRAGFTFLDCTAEATPRKERAEKRPDIRFDDFEREAYERWTATGAAFGSGPVEQDKMPDYQGKVGAQGKRLVNSHASAPGSDVGAMDAATGTLTSRPFAIERDYITFLIGGGAHKDRTCINLVVDDKAVVSATGRNDNRLSPQTWDVRPWAGKTARLQIVDNEKGSWGNIGIDDIVFTDTPRTPQVPLSAQYDYGTMGLALLREEPEARNPGVGESQRFRAADSACTALPDTAIPSGLFSKTTGDVDAPAERPFGQKLVGSLARRITLAPGQSATVTFVLTWHFPNIKLDNLGNYEGRHYGKRFANALAVADYVATHFDRLAAQTRLWHDTWYDSTLPYWFLERTLATASHLATNTCYWLGNGRFYAWEGVGCCAGTCTHVWHYAHAMARLFPQLERSLREMVDYGVGFQPATGRIRFRAEHNDHWAVDGQAGVILRTYREHLISADDAFLRRVWPRAKKALEFLISRDDGRDGIIDGAQHNTLDADWFGQVAWLSGLYLAALRAGEEMAREMGDAAFAQECREIFEKGRKLVDERLFNGEYYFHLFDPAHKKVVGSYDGCEIDQVFGDSWAWQVGLGHILDRAKVKRALQSLWRYNFTPDVGPYRAAYKPGRWYAMAGEGGLLMCTWPRGEDQRIKESFDFYFNECMTGFEYQVAWHMVAEGMLQEGFAITRAIHDRYHAARRNPWNEVECGDHYARAMASYGVYLAACGFEYQGPRSRIGFRPRLAPENFRCAFTGAEGWGTFSQRVEYGKHTAQIQVKWGKVHLLVVTLGLVQNLKPTKLGVSASGRTLPATLELKDGTAEIRLHQETVVAQGETVRIELE